MIMIINTMTMMYDEEEDDKCDDWGWWWVCKLIHEGFWVMAKTLEIWNNEAQH